MKLSDLEKEIKKHTKAGLVSDRFTKTSKGSYGHSLRFLNLKLNTAQLREIAKRYTELSFSDLKKLINDEFQQFRTIGIFILVEKFKSKENSQKERVLNFYLKNLNALNNWDLVDSSAYQILGEWLKTKKDRKILYKLARSKNLWQKRVAIVSTYAFIRNNDLSDTYKISKILLKDSHDLIHKAVGWMLRESGKIDQKRLEGFLEDNIRKMPRTTLRYAIERFEEKKRKRFLKL